MCYSLHVAVNVCINCSFFTFMYINSAWFSRSDRRRVNRADDRIVKTASDIRWPHVAQSQHANFCVWVSKKYCRSKTHDDRLEDLLLLTCEKDISDNLSLDCSADVSATVKDRRYFAMPYWVTCRRPVARIFDCEFRLALSVVNPKSDFTVCCRLQLLKFALCCQWCCKNTVCGCTLIFFYSMIY